MTNYIEQINKIYMEIKEIKSAECVMDYDAKTEVIQIKMKAIANLENINTMLASGGCDGVLES